MALGFSPSYQRGGDETMTAYEIIVIVIAIITLAFSIHNGNHKD